MEMETSGFGSSANCLFGVDPNPDVSISKKNCTLLDGHPLTIPTVFGGHRECVPDLLTE